MYSNDGNPPLMIMSTFLQFAVKKQTFFDDLSSTLHLCATVSIETTSTENCPKENYKNKPTVLSTKKRLPAVMIMAYTKQLIYIISSLQPRVAIINCITKVYDQVNVIRL